MQYLQPMHFSASIFTMPSARLWLAPVGHTLTHGASLQCMQMIGIKTRVTAGYSPNSWSFTMFQKIPGRVWFSALQATVQAMHPTHFLRSMTIPYLIPGSPWFAYFAL
jgi:hypothetical protein